MQHKKPTILQDMYANHLKIINGVNLTNREIDLISFFISGRSTKKIASFFSISPKTVENHAHNIMVKLNCNSREAIIDFAEKSESLPYLRKYYSALLAQSKYDSHLKSISSQLTEKRPTCSLICYEDNPLYNALIVYLTADLKHAGFSITNQKPDYSLTIQPIFQDPNQQFRVLCSGLSSQTVEIGGQHKIQELSGDPKSYFVFVLCLFDKLCPHLKLQSVIESFKNDLESADEAGEKSNIPRKSQGNRASVFSYSALKTKWLFPLFFGAPVAACIAFYIGMPRTETVLSGNTGGQMKFAVRSDFDIPVKSSLLNRLELLSEIEKKFDGKEGIQTLALVGIGGAGKTTIARRFAGMQDSSVVWEINAHTTEALNESFESLAQGLAVTEADEKLFRGLLQIKPQAEREERIVQFVKDRLKNHSNWFLIFDDVSKFSDIQDYFPIDPSKWGHGKIILTTQDSTIDNNGHINHTIFVDELKPEDKLDLFLKIMGGSSKPPFTPKQLEEAQDFLREIPPFPLDVSVAAYYIRATHISYKDYLESMLRYNKDFSRVQEQILQQAGDYSKTRYGIITLSLEQFMGSNSDLCDLLLFVSLLDSQNISRELLMTLKPDHIVDKFIYLLKHYSLIQNEASDSYSIEPTFSIHRSTQSIALTFLKNKLNLLEHKSLLMPIARALENYMASAVDREDFSKMKSLSRHAEQLLSHKNLLDQKANAILSGELGCIYYYLCDYKKSEQLLKSSLLALKNADPQHYTKQARYLVYLGSVHKRLGNYEQAKKLFEEGRLMYKKLPVIPVGMARASGYLGVIYDILGDYENARTLLEESLEIHEAHPQNRIGLAWSLAHLASVYRNIGDYEKSIELYKKSYSIYKESSEDYVGAAWVCVDLGALYLELGDLEKARSYLEESLAIYDKHFVREHVYVARAVTHLGAYYRAKGDFEKAKALLKESVDSFENTYGRNHGDTAWALENLGKVYLLQDEVDMAENILKEALHILKNYKSSRQYMALEDLSDLYERKSDTKASVYYLKQALENAKYYYPEESPYIIRLKAKLNERQVKRQ